LDILDCSDAQPVSTEVREQIVDVFISATSMTLVEMTQTEPIVRSVCRMTQLLTAGDISALLGLAAERGGGDLLVLSFPAQTAEALAGRVLAEVAQAPDVELIRDCMGELANVVAGQAKTLLAETPFQLALATPRILLGAGLEVASPCDSMILAVIFDSAAGEFALQVCLETGALRTVLPTMEG
jgi:chemotaxis protein CheX